MNHLFYSDRNFDNDICETRQSADILCCCITSRTSWDSQQSLLAMYHLGKKSQLITCPSCRSAQHTRVQFLTTKKTHVMAALMSPILFCWFPYVTGYFRVAVHYCSVCRVYIGRSDLQPVQRRIIK